MNENIDLTKILKDCPIGWEFYSSIYGYVTFHRIENGSEYPVKFFYIDKNNSKKYGSVTKQGLHVFYFNGECTLFPSKDQRDWSKFTAPWYNKESDTIALLEKQGEQEEHQVYETEDGKIITYSETDGYKFDDKIEPKFKVGDWIITPKNEVLQITNIEGTNYRFNNESHYWEICCCDEQCRFWTIEDAKDGDVLAAHECYVIFKEIDGLNIKCYCTYHYLGLNPSFYRDTLQNKDAFLPSTKEQRDSFMKAMNDAGYEWDIEKKELNKKKKFDPKTLKPFDKVLVRRDSENYNVWFPDFVSDPPNDTNNKTSCMCIMEDITMVIPYNDETKNLIGTTYDAPEHYKYWED